MDFSDGVWESQGVGIAKTAQTWTVGFSTSFDFKPQKCNWQRQSEICLRVWIYIFNMPSC